MSLPRLVPSLVILALLGSPGPGRSENETTELSKTPVFEGGAVVTATRSEVSADRLPVEVSILDREEIAASGAHTMDDVLRQIPSFQLRREQSSEVASTIETSIAFRGLGGTSASRALVLLDGIPMNDPFQGYVRWGQVPVESVERVEVVRGGSVVWGNLGIGGTVNLLTTTRGMASERLTLEVGERSRQAVTAGMVRKHEATTVSLRGFYQSSGGYSRVSAEERGDVDLPVESDVWTVGVTADFSPSERTGLRVQGSWFDENRLNGTVVGDRDRSAALTVALGGQSTASATRYWSYHLFGNRLDVAGYRGRASRDRTRVTPSRDQYDIPTDSIGADLQLSVRPGRHELAFGGDVRWTEGEVDELSVWNGSRFTVDGQSGGTQTLAGLYVQDLVPVGERWTVYGALRWDRWESADGFVRSSDAETNARLETELFSTRSGSVVSPSLGATARVGDRSLIRFAAYGGFRAPTLNELYKPVIGPSGKIASNPGVAPEDLRGLEVGWSFQPRVSSEIGVTVFRAEVEGLIQNVTIGDAGDEPEVIPPCGEVAAGLTCRQRQNVGEMRSQGVELSARHEFRGGYRLRLSGLVQDAEIVSSPAQPQLEGKRVQQAPDWVGTLSFGGPLTERGSFNVSYRMVSDRFDDDLEEDYVGETRSLNLVLGWRLRQGLDASVQVVNALDRENPVGLNGGQTTVGPPRLVALTLRWVGGRP